MSIPFECLFQLHHRASNKPEHVCHDGHQCSCVCTSINAKISPADQNSNCFEISRLIGIAHCLNILVGINGYTWTSCHNVRAKSNEGMYYSDMFDIANESLSRLTETCEGTPVIDNAHSMAKKHNHPEVYTMYLLLWTCPILYRIRHLKQISNICRGHCYRYARQNINSCGIHIICFDWIQKVADTLKLRDYRNSRVSKLPRKYVHSDIWKIFKYSLLRHYQKHEGPSRCGG